MRVFAKIITSVVLMAIAVVLVGTHTVVADDILEQKKDLEQINKDIEKSKANLSALREKERGLVNEISDYEQRATMNKTVLNRLNNQLAGMNKQVDSAKAVVDENESAYELTRERYLINLRVYYIGARIDDIAYAGEINRERDALNRIKYLGALAGYDKEQLTKAVDYLSSAETMYSGLVDEEKKVGNIRKKKRSEYTILNTKKESREKDLYQVKRKKENEADRLVSLNEEAKQMQDLISRLEREKAERQRNRKIEIDLKTGNFLGYKGKLRTPLKGTIVSGYGWKTDKKTYLKSFSPGIEIKGKANSSVKAIADGIVVYTGRIRGYGVFVILEHEDGYYSTYAGIENLSVIKEQIMTRGDLIGVTTDGRLKFELRKGRDPVDPVEWINIESFK